MVRIRRACIVLSVISLGLSGCRTATSSDANPFFPEILLVKNDLLESGNVCYNGQPAVADLNNPAEFLEDFVVIFRGNRIYLKGDNFFFENGRQSPITWSNLNDFENDIEHYRVGCGPQNITEVIKLDEYNYLIQPLAGFWTGYSIDSIEEAKMKALGASEEDISNFLNNLKIFSLGISEVDFRGDPSFGLIIRFFEGDFAEGAIYSHASQSIIGRRILYTVSEETSERGHHYLTLSGITCDVADDADDITYSSEFREGTYSRQIESCIVSEYDDLLERRETRDDKATSFSSTNNGFSFSFLRPDPILPNVMALDFQELLDPDLSDEILRAER